MEEYKKQVMKYNRIKNDLQSERQNILDSGKTDDWKRERLAEVNEKTVKELREWDSRAKMIADEYAIAGQEIFEGIRKKPAGKVADAPSCDLHRGLALDAFSGLKPEEILEVFGRVVGGLAEDDLGVKWVYENTVRSLIREPSYNQAIEETFDKHRTPLEKAAHNEHKRRDKFLANDSTIRGIAENEIDEIIHGNSPIYDDIETLYIVMMSD